MLTGLKNIKGKKGQAMVEMALILPILLLLVFGMIDFGRVFNGYLVATAASREGARVAILSSGNDNSIETAVRAASSTLDQTKLTVTTTPATRVSGDPVTVSVTYNIDIITPLINTFLMNPLPINCQTTMRVE